MVMPPSAHIHYGIPLTTQQMITQSLWRSVMRRSVLSVLGLVLTAVALAQQAPTYQSPVSLCVGPSPQQVFVAEETAGTVAVLDLASRQVQRRLKVPMRPRALALAGDSRLPVAGGDEKGVLAFLSLPEGPLEAPVSLGHAPTALAQSSSNGPRRNLPVQKRQK